MSSRDVAADVSRCMTELEDKSAETHLQTAAVTPADAAALSAQASEQPIRSVGSPRRHNGRDRPPLANNLREKLGRTVNVENRPGASG